MYRRWMAVLLALVLTLSVGSSVLAQKVTVIARAVEGGVNWQVVEWMTKHVFPAFREKLEAEGRSVELEFIQFGGSDEALKQQYALDLSVGAGADIMAFDGFWVPEFVEAGYLKPLDHVAGAAVWDWEGWQHIPEGLRGLLGFQGEVYGLGLGTDVRKLYYRADLFEQAGIPVPWEPKTWEDVLETARQLKAHYPGSTPLQINAGTAMGEATTMQGYFMVLLGTGIHMYDFEQGKWIVEHPGILDTLNLYKQVYVDEGLGDRRMQLLAQGREQSFAAFRDGRIMILAEGDWFWRSVVAPGSEWEPPGGRNAVVRWAPFPAQEPGKGYGGTDFVSISGGTGYVLNPNSQNPELAWELLSFMFSTDMMLALQNIQPGIRIRSDVPVVGDPVMSAMAEKLLPVSTVRPQLPAYPRISVEAQLMTERVITGEMTPEEAMQAYAEAVVELVGEENVIRVR
ncbi:MAG TPA: extracellular solute-binding protein [Limnochordales bacterium]|nr:extracellular solute-binding protein [Limnochordales bacterium]